MQSLWKKPDEDDDIGVMVYSSRLLGSESDLVLHGGGNTSVKTEEVDHTGKKISVLRVKGSGSDLSAMKRSDFTGLRLQDLLAAKDLKAMDDLQMEGYLKKSMIDPEEASPSVETFLHAFVPFKYVNHSHADSILSLANTELTDAELKKILGNMVVIPYISPGFGLAKAIADRADKIKHSDGVVLRNHGLVTFSDSAKESYEKHIRIVTSAENHLAGIITSPIFTRKFDSEEIDETKFLPRLRGILSQNSKKILKVSSRGLAAEIALSAEGEELCLLGPPTSDMLIRTKHKFLYVASPENIEADIERYVRDYKEEQGKYAGSYQMHDPYPGVILVRGYGIITQSTSAREAEIIMDMALHSFTINGKSLHVGKHASISTPEAYHMEYWPLQEAKLKRRRKERLEGTVSVVTGAASGIGLEAFRELASKGSHVVAIDIDPGIGKISEEVYRESGRQNLPACIDLSDEGAIEGTFKQAIREFGGIDFVFNNAGILKTAPIDEITTSEMDRVFAVNGRGTFIVTREAFRIMKTQGIGGNFVFNITKNLTNPGAEMAMYGSTKAFAAHLSHYVAKEGGKYRIRSNIINPDKVFRGSKIWEGGILQSRAKAKGQSIEEYKTQNSLGIEVLPSHVVGVMMALLDEESFGATTDAMIPVDGGIR